MKRKVRAVILLNLLFFGIESTYGQTTTVDLLNGDTIRTITTAVPFLTIAPDARTGAMGEAGGAISPDVNSLHYNTAKMSFLKKDYAFSTSYTPWLRNVIDDMALGFLAGYKKVGEGQVVTGSLRYFDLGDINFTDENAVDLGTRSPKEYALTAGYGMQLSQRLAVGLNLKFINSDLTNGLELDGVRTRPGRTAAGDVSIFYKSDMVLSGKPAKLAFASTFSNIGAKISYTNSLADNKDFLPANLRIGSALEVEMDQFQSFTFSLDLNKFLVPSPPVYGQEADANGNRKILYGEDPDKSVPAGIFGSFTDAAGTVQEDENGDPVVDENGNYVIEKGSRLKEELREIIFCAGAEYWYREMLAFRAGYFKENPTKGNREFLTFGFGVRYQFIGVDVAYLAALRQNNPLANTLRFTLMFNFDADEPTSLN